MYCQQCGQKMEEGQRFCVGCGTAAPVLKQPVFQVHKPPVIERSTMVAPVKASRPIGRTEKIVRWTFFSAAALFVLYVIVMIVYMSTPNYKKQEAERKEKERVAMFTPAEREAEKEIGRKPEFEGVLPSEIKYLYIRRKLKDPDSLKDVRWSRTFLSNDGKQKAWAFMVSYRAKNSFGAYVPGCVLLKMRNDQIVEDSDCTGIDF